MSGLTLDALEAARRRRGMPSTVVRARRRFEPGATYYETERVPLRFESRAAALAACLYSNRDTWVVAVSAYERAGRPRVEVEARGLAGTDALAAVAIRALRDAGLASGVFDVVEAGAGTSRDGVMHREFEVAA